MDKKHLIAGLIIFITGCDEISSPIVIPAKTNDLTIIESVSPSLIIPLPIKSLPIQTTTPLNNPKTNTENSRTRTSDGMIMVYVPAGEFIMGAANDDPEADQHEKPEHVVYVDAFWIDSTEVTNWEYRKCVEAGFCHPPNKCDFGAPTYNDPSKADHPVVCIDWYEALTYCHWAGGQLPTEAQWEKAARGTAGLRYPWGDTIDCSRGNFRGCNEVEQTMPVGSYPNGSSPYGALDMAGNVWEWVSDWMGWDYYEHSPYINPAGAESGDMRSVRGGSYRYGFLYMRAATRHCAPSEHRANPLGVRCVVLD